MAIIFRENFQGKILVRNCGKLKKKLFDKKFEILSDLLKKRKGTEVIFEILNLLKKKKKLKKLKKL